MQLIHWVYMSKTISMIFLKSAVGTPCGHQEHFVTVLLEFLSCDSMLGVKKGNFCTLDFGNDGEPVVLQVTPECYIIQMTNCQITSLAANMLVLCMSVMI